MKRSSDSLATAPKGAIRLEVHPIAEIIPAFISKEEQTALQDSIAARGQRVPIVLFEGKLLDGRARYLACLELDKTPEYTTFEGSEADARDLVLDMNVRRKHLKGMQKALIAARLSVKDNISVRSAATLVGVGHYSVNIAAQLLSANETALIKRCEKGELSRSDAEEATERTRARNGNVIPMFGSAGSGGSGQIASNRTHTGHTAVETTPSKLAKAFQRMKPRDRRAFVELAWKNLEPVLTAQPWRKAKNVSARKDLSEKAEKQLAQYFGTPRPASDKEKAAQQNHLLKQKKMASKGMKKRPLRRTMPVSAARLGGRKATKGKARASK